MSASGVRRDKAALSSGCEPTRQPLQSEGNEASIEGQFRVKNLRIGPKR
jgi:hypothetical protein